jgi:hypothetical protein
MMARTDSQLEKMETTVDVFKERLNKMDIKDLMANRGKLEVVAEQQDIPQEKGAVKTIRALEGRYGDRHLAVGRRLQTDSPTCLRDAVIMD